MRKQHAFFGLLLVTILLSITLNSCKKSESSTPITLSTLMAGSINLNSATAPTGVPVNPTITATFATAVDTSTTRANITLIENYDTVTIPVTITASGTSVTITPKSNLANGALYQLNFLAGLKATDGTLLTAITRSFTTTGSFLPSGPAAYWNFDGNANDQTGTYSATNSIGITYTSGRNATSGQCAVFDGATSLIEIPNGDKLMLTNDFSLSFWVYEDSVGKRDQFVMGLSAWYGFQFEINNDNGVSPALGECKLAAQYNLSNGTTASQDLWFNGAATNSTLNNGGWKGWTFCKDLVSNNGTGVNGLLAEQWAHVVCTYSSVTKIGTIYINGQEMKAQDFNLYGDPMDLSTGLKFAGNAANNSFVFGFIQDKTDPTETDTWADYTNPANGHFKGKLDDVAIYHKVLSPSIITLMYNSGKP